MTVWRPRDMPGLRADMVRGANAVRESLATRAADPGWVTSAARHSFDLAESADHFAKLARQLAVASLWWVTPTMTHVAFDAAADIPAWSPGAAIPDEIGLLIWEDGLPPVPWRSAPETAWTDGPLGQRPPLVPVSGILWRHAGTTLDVLLLTQSAPIRDHLHGRHGDTPLFAFAQLGSSEETIGVDAESTVEGSASLLGVIGATWLLMGQPTISERTTVDPPPRLAEAARRARRPDPVVTVVDLRRARPADAGDREPSGRHLTHRHVVRGHWRQQACGPDRSLRRPTWIAPHVRGPDGAPFVRSEVVMRWAR